MEDHHLGRVRGVTADRRQPEERHQSKGDQLPRELLQQARLVLLMGPTRFVLCNSDMR